MATRRSSLGKKFHVDRAVPHVCAQLNLQIVMCLDSVSHRPVFLEGPCGARCTSSEPSDRRMSSVCVLVLDSLFPSDATLNGVVIQGQGDVGLSFAAVMNGGGLADTLRRVNLLDSNLVNRLMVPHQQLVVLLLVSEGHVQICRRKVFLRVVTSAKLDLKSDGVGLGPLTWCEINNFEPGVSVLPCTDSSGAIDEDTVSAAVSSKFVPFFFSERLGSLSFGCMSRYVGRSERGRVEQ